MLKPSERSLQIIRYLQNEFETSPNGRFTKTAAHFGVTKQAVFEVFQRYPQYFSSHLQKENAPVYFTCFVCEELVPEALRGKVRKGCRDCEEHHIRKCGKCGCRFIRTNDTHSFSLCPQCAIECGVAYQKKMLAAGGEYRERILRQRRECNDRWRAKLSGERRTQFMERQRTYWRDRYASLSVEQKERLKVYWREYYRKKRGGSDARDRVNSIQAPGQVNERPGSDKQELEQGAGR